MADRQGERVRRVVGTRDGLELQKPLDHIHHLPLFGKAIADDRLLDLHGRVLKHGHAGLCPCQQHNAAPMPHMDGGGDIGVEKELLHRHGVDGVAAHKLLKEIENLQQPLRELLAGRGAKGVVFQRGKAVFLVGDHPIAHRGDSGVDPEDYHRGASASFSSSSFWAAVRMPIWAVSKIIPPCI